MRRRFKQWSRRAMREVWRRRHAGNDVECLCCGTKLQAFMPSGRGYRRDNAECPTCGSRERHRFHALILEKRELWGDSKQSIDCLFVAPDRATTMTLERAPHWNTTTTDLYLDGVDVKADLTKLPMQDESFDRIICSNVLEHIPDDRAAMRELGRVLKPTGVAIIDVPIRADGEFDEDIELSDPAQRHRRFGGHDHLRWYDARTFKARLAESGLEAEQIDPETFGTQAERDRYRIALFPVFLVRRGESRDQEPSP